MFGEGYFNTRDHLVSLATRVRELADKTGADKSSLMDEDILFGENSPFLFLACGEVGAGKSTLLNGIFGEEVCESGPPGLRWYKYGEKTKDKVVTPSVSECYRPVYFLNQFSLMDTPGINSSVPAAKEMVERFLPTADIVLWVLSVENPWEASVWKFLSSQNEKVLKKSLIVLQKVDSRDEGELDIILGHVQNLAEQRLGFVPTIFPVSAQMALRAKFADPVDVSLWQKSGFAELEQRIEELVTRSPARQDILRSIRMAVAEVLRNVESTVDHHSRLLEGNEQFLQDLEAEVDEERKKHSAFFYSKFAGMRELLAGQNKELKRYVRKKLGLFSTLKSLFIAENTAKVIERWVSDSIEASVKAQAKIDGGHLAADCKKHWETVQPRVKERLSITLANFEEEADGFEAIQEEFQRNMSSAARNAAFYLRIRKELAPLLIVRREHLKSWLYTTLILVIVAGVVGALGWGESFHAPWWILAASGMSFLVFSLRVRMTARKVTRYLGNHLEASRSIFSESLETEYKEGVRCFYAEYGTLLSGVRKHIFNAQQALQPNLDERNRLFLELMILEQEL